MRTRLGYRKDANIRLRHDPLAKDHGGGSATLLNAIWPPASQMRALMVAKASAGLARAAEGEPQRWAVAEQPKSASVASRRGEAHGQPLASPVLHRQLFAWEAAESQSFSVRL